MVLWSTRALGVSLVELRQEEKQNNIFVNKQVSAVVGQLFRRRLKVHLEDERWLQHALGWRQQPRKHQVDVIGCNLTSKAIGMTAIIVLLPPHVIFLRAQVSGARELNIGSYVAVTHQATRFG
jgi:hypothetical protein